MYLCYWHTFTTTYKQNSTHTATLSIDVLTLATFFRIMELFLLFDVFKYASKFRNVFCTMVLSSLVTDLLNPFKLVVNSETYR